VWREGSEREKSGKGLGEVKRGTLEILRPPRFFPHSAAQPKKNKDAENGEMIQSKDH
jgi:hypothetical protein